MGDVACGTRMQLRARTKVHYTMGKNETQLSAGQYRLLIALGQQVDALNASQVWTLLTTSIVLIALLDIRLYAFQVFCAPLYLLPMCLESWRLGVKVGFAVAFLAASLPFVVGAAHQNPVPLIIGMANLTLHATALCFLVAIVSSFRYAHDR